jgi:hypothetical protein
MPHSAKEDAEQFQLLFEVIAHVRDDAESFRITHSAKIIHD